MLNENQEPDLKSLKIFVQVARLLSITAAAEQLKMPKSAVSKTITRLEKLLATKLLERSTRVVRLTEAGSVLFDRAGVILNEAQTLFDDFRNMSSNVSGQLNIAAAPAFGRYLSQSLLPQFLKRWPQVSLNLTLSYGLENLFEKGIDVAFRFGKIDDDRLIAKTIGYSQRLVVASPEYLAEAAKISKPQDLPNHRCLVMVCQYQMSNWTLTNGQQTMTVQVPAHFFCGDLDAIKNAALGGAGLAELPVLIIHKELEQGLLVPVLPGWNTPKLPLSLVYRENLNKPPKLAAFLAFLEEHLDLSALDSSVLLKQ